MVLINPMSYDEYVCQCCEFPSPCGDYGSYPHLGKVMLYH